MIKLFESLNWSDLIICGGFLYFTVTCTNYGILLPHFLAKISWKRFHYTVELTKYFSGKPPGSDGCTVLKNEKFILTEIKFRQTNYLAISLLKNVIFSRDFCQKGVRINFRNFHTHSLEKREIPSHWKKNSSNHLFSNFFSKTNAFTKFLRKKCEREFLQFPHCDTVRGEGVCKYFFRESKIRSFY